MTYSIEKNHLTEELELPISDALGLQYSLEILHTFDEQGHQISAIFSLNRTERNCRVGQASCLFISPEELLIGDLEIYGTLPFANLNDKFYRLSHWHEPSNYQKRGLGTFLLKYMIDFAKARKAKRLHGSLTRQDIDNNPKLTSWFQRHGFQLESPTSAEVSSAVYRACLYL